jgi:hypothetical protein
LWFVLIIPHGWSCWFLLVRLKILKRFCLAVSWDQPHRYRVQLQQTTQHKRDRGVSVKSSPTIQDQKLQKKGYRGTIVSREKSTIVSRSNISKKLITSFAVQTAGVRLENVGQHSKPNVQRNLDASLQSLFSGGTIEEPDHHQTTQPPARYGRGWPQILRSVRLGHNDELKSQCTYDARENSSDRIF